MRERLLALDGLRGIAALAVFWLHFRGRPDWLTTQAGLAVDFFFVLSGFVLAYAYEQRLHQTGGVSRFLRDRVIRLHPLLVLSLIPAAVILASVSGHLRDPVPLLTFAASAIPFPALWLYPLPAMSFPYNPPSWSLFWELVANLLFALVVPRTGMRALATIMGLLIVVRFALTLWTGHFYPIDLTAGPRALSTFALGVLLYRLHAAGRMRLPRWLAVLAAPLLIATLIFSTHGPARILLPVYSYLLYPLIIAAAADRPAQFPRLCTFLGSLSYPLYILHLPVLAVLSRLFGPPVEAPNAFLQAFACLLIVWLAQHCFDAPVRRALRRRFGSADPAKAEPS